MPRDSYKRREADFRKGHETDERYRDRVIGVIFANLSKDRESLADHAARLRLVASTPDKYGIRHPGPNARQPAILNNRLRFEHRDIRLLKFYAEFFTIISAYLAQIMRYEQFCLEFARAKIPQRKSNRGRPRTQTPVANPLYRDTIKMAQGIFRGQFKNDLARITRRRILPRSGHWGDGPMVPDSGTWLQHKITAGPFLKFFELHEMVFGGVAGIRALQEGRTKGSKDRRKRIIAHPSDTVPKQRGFFPGQAPTPSRPPGYGLKTSR